MATHDEHIIREAQAFAIREYIARDSFEFEMLYGIRRDLQQSLVRDGWRMRVYVPFGTEWYPYFMRRLGERPANVFFIARNMLCAVDGLSSTSAWTCKRQTDRCPSAGTSGPISCAASLDNISHALHGLGGAGEDVFRLCIA